MNLKYSPADWRIVAVVCAALFVGGFFYARHRADALDAELAVLRSQNDSRRAQIDSLLGGIAEQNSRLAALNASLTEANRKLDKQDKALAAQAVAIREAAAGRDEEIKTLPLDAIARETLLALSLEPPAVHITDNGDLAFTPDAARTNLQALARGQAAIAELDIANRRIDNLYEQIGNLSEINSNLDGLLVNKGEEMRARLERAGLKQAETEKALQVEKAKGRKRNFIVGAIGFIAGVIVAAL